MSRPLFEFRLRPLAQIEPWGRPDDPNLHWFGLSDGCYWLNVGERALLEYSPQFQAEAGVRRYCDYQVVRLHEDLLDMLPHVLAPVPPALREFIALRAEPQTDCWSEWTSLDLTEPQLGLLSVAGGWLGRRSLDTLYLSPSARITMWSDEREVHIQWDHRGIPAWTASWGSFSLSRADFLDEVRSFHGRFMREMAERVAHILETGAPPGVRIDLAELGQEQRRREALFELGMQACADATDWVAVSAAVSELEAIRKAAPR